MESITATYGASAFNSTLDEAHKRGYTFINWYAENTFDNVITNNAASIASQAD